MTTTNPHRKGTPEYVAWALQHTRETTGGSRAPKARTMPVAHRESLAAEQCNHGVPVTHPCDECTPPQAQDDGRKLSITWADTITMRAPKWLDDQRIPAGAITLLAGREGIGKSTITADLIARVTRGRTNGIYAGVPKSVAIVATEDAWAEVIAPRLAAAGADLGRVGRLDVHEDGEETGISVPADLSRLAQMCATEDVVMVVLDPIMSVVDGRLDTHKDREVRKALDPLARFAAQHGVTVFGLIHVNKSAGNDPGNTVMGSRAFSAVARSVLFCIADPENEGTYLYGHVKSNLSPKQPTIAYTITSHRIDLPSGEVIPTSRIKWGDTDKRSIGEALDATNMTKRGTGPVATEILAWVMAQGRTVSTEEVTEQFPTVSAATLRKNLSRMVDRKQLDSPARGYYCVSVVTGACDTSPIPSQASLVSQVSLDLAASDGCDGCDAVTGAGGTVTTAPSLFFDEDAPEEPEGYGE